MKNVVFMMNVDLGKEGRFASSRINPYKYSIDSWKKWCDKNDCELFVLTEEVIDHDVMGICWQRWYIFDLLESYSKHVFDGHMLKEWSKYFDSGFWIVNKTHKPFAKKLTDFYHANSELLRKMETTFLTGTEQTPLNFMLDIENIDVKHLPYEFNMCDMNRKEILSEDLLFTKLGWIFQFNCIPNNKDNELTDYWMKKTYNHFYGDYKE